MADEPKAKRPKKVKEPEVEGSAVAAPEKTKGAKADKIAPPPVAEPAPAPTPAKSTKPLKLQKKNKSRLPRRQKKALQKAAAKQTAAKQTAAKQAKKSA